MSRRTVVAVEATFDDRVSVRLMVAPQTYAEAIRPRLFECSAADLPAWTVDGAVAKYGQLLREKLVSAHGAVRDALADSLRAPAGEVRPVYFMITADPAEGLHWEALCTETGSFLALDRRWPIGRMAHTGRDWESSGPRPFTPPLRMLAVISALGVDGRPEWRRLYEAVQAVRNAGLPVRLRVLVGEQELVDELQKLAPGEVEFATLKGGGEQLENEVNAFAPQVLHFFCHGTSSFGSRLEFATIADRDDPERTTGSVTLSGSQLVNLQAMKQLWLVTLNCCEGAKGGSDVRSLAHSLVADGGVPAVVGMAEPVDASDAHQFCGAFYGAVLEDIRAAAQAPPGTGVEVEWARGLYSPRRRLADAHDDAARSRQWLLPVLYVGVTPFAIEPVPADDPVARTRESLVMGTISTMGPDTPPGLIDDLRSILGAPTPAPGGG